MLLKGMVANVRKNEEKDDKAGMDIYAGIPCRMLL